MLVTREADYAIRCVLEVARRGRISAAQVAQLQGISPTFLGKIVQSLARAGILSTRRGVGGGMTLAVPVEAITILQVIEAVEGPLCINDCLTTPPRCMHIPTCPAYPILCRAQESLRELLNVNFSEMLDEARTEPAAPIPAALGATGWSPDCERGKPKSNRGGGQR